MRGQASRDMRDEASDIRELVSPDSLQYSQAHSATTQRRAMAKKMKRTVKQASKKATIARRKGGLAKKTAATKRRLLRKGMNKSELVTKLSGN
jgi:hypothetical protein